MVFLKCVQFYKRNYLSGNEYHVIIQVKKIQEFDVIQVLFKPSTISQGFD